MTTVTADTSWQLLGVLATSDSSAARAILRHDGKVATLVLAVGDEVNGVRLKRIANDGILLVAGGRESRLGLPAPGNTPLNEPTIDD